jgi:hypothetical protein
MLLLLALFVGGEESEKVGGFVNPTTTFLKGGCFNFVGVNTLGLSAAINRS